MLLTVIGTPGVEYSVRRDHRVDRRGGRIGGRVSGAARVVHLDDLERLDAAGVGFRPIRRRLGVRTFGVNAYTARTEGDQVIEDHHENGHRRRPSRGALHGDDGPGRVHGGGRGHRRAGGDARVRGGHRRPAGRRCSRATTRRLSSSAARLRLRSRPRRSSTGSPPSRRTAPATTTARSRSLSEGLTEWPDHGMIHYQLACYLALAGRREEALFHIRKSIAAENARAAGWASRRPRPRLDPRRSRVPAARLTAGGAEAIH